ncbi:Ribosomal RNA small subunit methyltransferase E [uncultured Clostridium sp.]|uniref:Ribosomal RNA small subunit methyltransferase E n=1 Tax=Paeniclostridium hominis TaxID=2764329 RepID=A0ABR7K053_9FIRM|nr:MULTISPECIES: 16S rRNA (uracil(1498)-N(3))-methyltransferase [Paeniclostridium]MDU1539192.1 16S rRNA (uracil(1498)-N(3))-methyltransferase [Paeniclostridium sordellii]SCJ21715.1 Ribosomal RNA small subunit methyltransferase E [uncultured Clostridium sp.]MBC6002315.1 16S rRNA (uracil(1498)-N(3))-methyltransferase [Paeniclostridium hominis]MDU2591320.1 16S rRNA (uracil(1498)-N(3))-methyltransferase [Paeniclostridium sordellii]SCJ21838.1 Ribosomal RNA small subunit methyltransferase E [uncultu
MDRFFVEKKNVNLENNTCIIEGEDVKHISKVLRCRVGEELEICDNDNNEYICEITNIDKSQVNLNILKRVDIKRESDLKIKVYQGLPKGPKMEMILQKLTEVGVDEIILVQTKRTVVKVDDKKEDKKIERWERIIYEAAKQSKRGKIPKLRGVLSFKEALADMKENDFNIAPYENEKTKTIKQAIKGKDINNIGIFVGPEGGFEDTEINAIEEIGGQSVSLGPRILRTETASLVASSIVLYELSDLGGGE